MKIIIPFPTALAFALTFGMTLTLTAHAATTVSDACLLNQVRAVSPLKEDLNYTRGSGRGYDAVFTRENTEARVGNISFSTSAGDQIQFAIQADGTRTYNLQKARTNIVYQMSIYSSSPYAGGKYGGSGAGSERSARLSYQDSAHAKPVELAGFTCN